MFLGIIYSISGCVVGNGAVTGVCSTANGSITLPSAKTRMIQSVGVHLLWLVREYHRLLDKDGGGDEWMKIMDRWFSV